MFNFLNTGNSPQAVKNEIQGLIIKPYSSKELRQLYQVSQRTLLKWLQPFKGEIGKRNGHFYTVPQVEIIFSKLGVPYTINEKSKQ